MYFASLLNIIFFQWPSIVLKINCMLREKGDELFSDSRQWNQLVWPLKHNLRYIPCCHQFFLSVLCNGDNCLWCNSATKALFILLWGQFIWKCADPTKKAQLCSCLLGTPPFCSYRRDLQGAHKSPAPLNQPCCKAAHTTHISRSWHPSQRAECDRTARHPLGVCSLLA